MSTAAEASHAPSSTGALPPAALLFEIEGAALPVRQALFEAARAYLAERQVALDEKIFTRCAGSIAMLAAQLCAQLNLDGGANELSAAITGALADRLNAGSLKMNRGMEKMLDAVARRGLPAAALTGLPESVAQIVYHAAGLSSRGIQLFVFSDEDKPFPRADAWLKVVKQLGKTARFCIAIGSSQVACKSALSAGLRTIAAPDAYTGHHDFGGADLVIESWDDIDIEQALDILIPTLR